jgi:Rrf2 family nitric oxide-sensitive transcriptional repressor
MHLTQFSDIGLRLLMYLAREPRVGHTVTVAEVSSQFNIPRNHLVKVAGQLTRQGWIDATRGRTGGIRLAVEPALLSLGQVVRVLEGEKELVNCEKMECRLRGECGLRHALSKAHEAFYVALDEYTLADLVAKGTGKNILRMHQEYLAIN